MRIYNTAVLVTAILFFSSSANAALNLPKIKLEMAKMEELKDKKIGLSKCEELLAEINKEEKGKENSAEYYTWKGIVVAKMAHYSAPNLKALSLAKEARENLEKAVEIDEKNSGAAALNALGILYHRVPKFISFGDDEKAEEYFKRATQTPSNLDTNWRYGQFLLEKGRDLEGLQLLKTAASEANLKKPDEEIKQKLVLELIKKYE